MSMPELLKRCFCDRLPFACPKCEGLAVVATTDSPRAEPAPVTLEQREEGAPDWYLEMAARYVEECTPQKQLYPLSANDWARTVFEHANALRELERERQAEEVAEEREDEAGPASMPCGAKEPR